MQVEFADTLPAAPAVIARFVGKDALPSDLEEGAREGAKANRFSGGVGEVFETFAARDGATRRIALAGLGKPDAADRQANLEKAGAALAAKYMTSGVETIALDLSGDKFSAADVAALLLGMRLRAWRLDTYRTKQKNEDKLSLGTAVVVGAPEGDGAYVDGEALYEGVRLTRELVTEPANVIYPESYVERVRERFADTDAELTVLDEDAMRTLGMGALLAVGQGSERESRLLAIRWNGGGDEKPLAFVGKGVTFDTGGISIKPGPGMEDMKWDMGGSAAVVGAMLTLARRRAKANVIGVVGLVENMPDGKAQRPGDVVTSMSGQTIEVLNTDAEGRLVLADALTWVQREHEPRVIVDFATLTGAIIVSLGHEHAGLFGNDDDLAAALTKAGAATGDKVWRLPLGKPYDKLLDSPIADMKNIGGKAAGSITAAQFLQRFVEEGTPWCHVDIAGTVWTDKPGRTWGKGATGFGVRLIDRYVRDAAGG